MSLYDQNLAKIAELLPNCQERVKRWMKEAFDLGWEFKISEAYRTQERQNELYKIGRREIKGEVPVTYTRSSNHTKRIAIDVYPATPAEAVKPKAREARLVELDQLGVFYGVFRPPETRAFGDMVHYEVYNLPIPPESPMVSKRREERARRNQEAILQLKRDALAAQAAREKEPRKSRLEKRLSIPPTPDDERI